MSHELRQESFLNEFLFCRPAQWVSSLREMESVAQLPACYQTNCLCSLPDTDMLWKIKRKKTWPIWIQGSSPQNAQFLAASHYLVISKSSLLTTGHPTVSRHQKTIGLPPWMMKPEKIQHTSVNIQVSRQSKNKCLCFLFPGIDEMEKLFVRSWVWPFTEKNPSCPLI